MKNIVNRLIVPATLALFFVSCGGGKPVDLKLNLEKGKTYGQSMTMEQDISQSMMGQKMDMKQTMRMGYLMQVNDVAADGTLTIDTTYDSVYMKTSAPMMSMEYDSADPDKASGPLASIMNCLVSKTVTVVMEPKGAVKDIQGMDAIMSEMINTLNLPAGPARQQMEQQFKEQFGPDALKQSFGQSFMFFPKDPVKPGDSWSNTIAMKAGFPMVVETTYTLKERKDGIAFVDMKSTIKTGEGGKINMGMATADIKINGKQQGVMQIDEKTGWTVSAQMTQDLSGEVSAMGQKIPMSIKSTITVADYKPVKKAVKE